MTQVDTRARVAGSLLALLFAVACGDENSEKTDRETIQPTPTIYAFRASPASALAGEAVTLTWSTENAVTITITDDADRPLPVDEFPVAYGSVVIKPTETTSYTLTATGHEDAKSPATRTVTVQVKPAVDAPVIDAFAANPARVLVNGETTLSWRTSNATALTLKDDAGDEIPLGAASLADGSIGVRPTRSPTIYTLNASGGGLVATAKVNVEVDGLPRVHRFSVDPLQPVTVGSDVKLIWETSRADSVVIKDDQNNVVVNTSDASGVYTVLGLARTTDYRLTATGNGAEATASARAQVGAEIVEFTASPRVARVGDPIALTWKTDGAESVVITGPSNFRHEAANAAVGAIVDNLAISGDYTLHARRDDVVQTWSIFVETTEAPRIRSLLSDHSIITATVERPGKVILSYVQDGAATCTLYRNGTAVPGKTAFACLPSGDVEVELTGTADLRLVATNNAGQHQLSVHVDAVAPARIHAFTKDPARRLKPFGTVTLEWEVTGAERVWMTQTTGTTNVTVEIGDKEFKGDRAIVIPADTSFELFAENSATHVESAVLPVFAGPPAIDTFEVDPVVAVPSDTVTLSWTCDGGDSLVLSDGTSALRTETNPAKIDRDTHSFVAPSPSTLTYTITVTADDLETVRTATLLVTDGPLVRSLTASKSQIDLGSTVDISWVVANDYAGNKPTLVLKDKSGKTYDLPVDYNPNSGTVTIEPEAEGTYEFILTATTIPSARESSTDVDPVVVEVTVTPEIVSFTANPPSAVTQNGTVTPTSQLVWETKNAVDVWLFEATPAGDPIPPALRHISLTAGATRPDLDNGHFDLQSNSTKTYVLRASNRVGATVEETVSFLVDPPVIEFFEPDRYELIAGETVTLSWETTNATVAALRPMLPVVETLDVDAERFVDISTFPDAVALVLSGEDVFDTVVFPEGFVFPFDGQFFDRLQVASNGFLSFDMSAQTASSNNGDQPPGFPTDSTRRYVHMAVFWDALTGQNAGLKGSVFWRFDDLERSVTIMWKNWSLRDPLGIYDLNFEAILYENGSFEYRYGDFSTTNPLASDNIRGLQATFGFQDLRGDVFHVISHNSSSAMPLPGGAKGRAWFFKVATEPNGSRKITLPSSGTYTYTLTAASGESVIANHADSIASDEVSVSVRTAPSITEAWVYPTAPELGESIKVSWRTSSATRVRVVDELGEVKCEETDPNVVLWGSCEATPTAPGAHFWQVQAINAFERNVAVKKINFQVFPQLVIDGFGVSKTFVTAGETITASWASRGGAVVELYELDPISKDKRTGNLIAGRDPNAGSVELTVTKSSEFRFRLVDGLTYRAEEATANVWVDAGRLEDFTVSSAQIASGKRVELAWSTSGEGQAVTLTPLTSPIEITGEPGAGFVDISASGKEIANTCSSFQIGCHLLRFSDHNELKDFSFPYFGTKATVLTAMSEGVIALSAETSNQYAAVQAFPISSNPYNKLAIAPFWRNLQQNLQGKFYWELKSSAERGRYLILQWSHYEHQTTGTTRPTQNTEDLNFQVLLWENGHIDFRYGTMQSNNNTEAQVNGTGATMGIQAQGGTWAQTLKPMASRIPGDELSNRSWRFHVGAFFPDDSLAVAPTESTTYRLCMTHAQSQFEECHERRVVVVGSGDVMFSELMIAPTSEEAEWIEVRNTSLDPIDLADFMLTSGETEEMRFTVLDQAILPPGGFAIFSRSDDPAVNGIPSPTSEAPSLGGSPSQRLVYGDRITLPDINGEVRLRYGDTLVVDMLKWTAPPTWKIESNKSLVLEPSKFARDDSANDGSAAWCAASAHYNNGFYGSPGTLGSGCLTGGEHSYYVLDPVSALPWIDISQTGTALPSDIWSTTTGSTNYYPQPIPLGFAFPYFNDSVTEMTITSRGLITFIQPTAAVPSGNAALTSTTALNGMVAPMWDNLVSNTSNPATLRFGLREDDGVKVMVVSWNNAAPGNSSGLYGYVTFQLQLWETGDIVFVYGEPTPPTGTSYLNYTVIYGSSSTIGIKSIAGTLAYQIHSTTTDQNGQKPLYGGRAYRLARK